MSGMTTTTKLGRVGVNVGYATVACPLCGNDYETFDYFNVALDGVMVCPDCVEKTPELERLGGVLDALNQIELRLYHAQDDGADALEMANLCLAVQFAVKHIVENYMPDLGGELTP